jgi:hypothetical protein
MFLKLHLPNPVEMAVVAMIAALACTALITG